MIPIYILMLWLWVGGFFASFVLHSDKAPNIFLAIIAAITWPIFLGAALSDWAFRGMSK